MARLPTAADLGQNEQLRSQSVVPIQLGRAEQAQARAAEAGIQQGQAISGAGRTVMEIGQRMQEREDKINYVREKSNFIQSMVAAETEIGADGDTDYKTFGPRFNEKITKAKRDAISKIKNPDLKAQFEADADLDIQQGFSRMAAKSWSLERDNGVASMKDVITKNREMYLTVADPKLRESLMHGSQTAVQAALQNGYISKEQADQFSRNLGQDYAKGWISLQPAQAQAAILTSGEGPAAMIPADERKSLLDSIDYRGVSQGHADEIWSTGKTDAQKLADAHKIPDAKIRDEVVTRLKTRINERDALKQAVNDKAFSDAKDSLITNGWNIDAIPKDTWNNLSGDQRFALTQDMMSMADKLANGRKSDDWEVLDEIDSKIESGEITSTDQLRAYEPYLKDSTLSAKRKQVQKRDVVSGTDMQKAFELRTGKTKAKWGESQRVEYIAFQDYLLKNIKETRPEDMDKFADKWFMDGRGTNDRTFTDDPNTFGESFMKGRSDFVIQTPDVDKEAVQSSMTVLTNKGYKLPETDVFYTDLYLDATRVLEANNYPVTPNSVAAFAILKQSGKRTTVDRIRAVEEALSE